MYCFRKRTCISILTTGTWGKRHVFPKTKAMSSHQYQNHLLKCLCMFAGYIPPQLPTVDDEDETSAPRQQSTASEALTPDNLASISSGEAADVQTPLPSQRPGLDREHAGGASGSFSSLSVERSLDRHRDSSGSGGLMGSHHQHHLQVNLMSTCSMLCSWY